MNEVVIDIYKGVSRWSIYIPGYFEEYPIAKIKKLFSILASAAFENKEAYEKLDAVFIEWKEFLEGTLTALAKETAECETAVNTAKSSIACFGTMATEIMKKQLQTAERELKSAIAKEKRAKAMLKKRNIVYTKYVESKFKIS